MQNLLIQLLVFLSNKEVTALFKVFEYLPILFIRGFSENFYFLNVNFKTASYNTIFSGIRYNINYFCINLSSYNFFHNK